KQDPSFATIQFPSTYIRFITLNNRNPPLDDVNARMALNYATDRKTLIDVVLFGAGTEATTFLPKGALFWNDELPGFPFDLDKAKDFISKSKTPNGFKLDFMIESGDAEGTQLGTTLKDLWSKIGVDLQLDLVDQGTFKDAYDNNKFKAQYTGWTNDIIDPDEL